MKSYSIALATILAVCLLSFSSSQAGPCSAGKESTQGGNVSATTATKTMELAKSAKALEVDVASLQSVSSNEGCAGNDSCRKNTIDLLNQINKRADEIEAQIPSLTDSYSSSEMEGLLSRLQQRVVTLRANANAIAEKVDL